MNKLAAVLLILMTSVAIAETPIEVAIKKHVGVREGFKISTEITGKVNGHDSDLTVVQWTLLGPTYWQNFVSIFTSQHEELDTEVIYGLVDGMEIENGNIVLTLKTKGSDDPRCCPSFIEEKLFHIVESELSELPEF